MMCAHMIKMRKEHENELSIVYAHRREIVHQTAKKLEDAGLVPEIIMAGEEPNPWADVRVASVDTVWAKYKKGYDLPEAKFVAIDEVHRIGGTKYTKIVEEYKKKGSILMGMTATPLRNDGVGLGRYFEKMVRTPDVPWLIDKGYLVLPRYFVGIVPDLKGVRLTAGEYNQSDLDAVMNRKKLIGDILDNWMICARDKSTMVFASGVKHSMAIMQQFNDAGISAVHIDGGTNKKIRDDVYEKSKSGEIQVICSDSVYIEGTDIPWIQCIVDAHPTNSLMRYIQTGGRGMRAYLGKTGFIYIDHAGNVWRHGRLELPRDWILTEGKEQVDKLQKDRMEHERVQIKCPVCGFLISGPICSNCGAEFSASTPIGEDKKVLPATLVSMTMGKYAELTEPKKKAPKPDMAVKQEWLNGLTWLAEHNKFKHGWVANKYKDKWGIWPANGMISKPSFPSLTIRNWCKRSQQEWIAKKRMEESNATEAR